MKSRFFQVCLDFSSSYEISFLNIGRAKKTALRYNSISKPAQCRVTLFTTEQELYSKLLTFNAENVIAIIRWGISAAEPSLLGHEWQHIMLIGHVTAENC